MKTPDQLNYQENPTANQPTHLSETSVARILADVSEPESEQANTEESNTDSLIAPSQNKETISNQSKTPEYQTPSERFRVNPADYPIFCQQSSLNERWGNNSAKRRNIDHTLSTFVTDTAELIATIDGSSTDYEAKPNLPKPDHIIYLDKSARPVSWLVNTFWNDFSIEERPPHSYLNIDRIDWFHAAGVNVDADGDIIRSNGIKEQATGADFDPDQLPPDTFARIRSLFLPDGIESEDPETIMNTPSILNNKNILIVDEVGKSGSTLAIAKQLIERAVPEVANVRGAYFWHPGYKASQDGTKRQMLSVPVWYDAKMPTGRGVGDVDEQYYIDRYDAFPNNKTRAQKYGAKILSAALDLDTEDQITHFSSRELMREIAKMHQDFQNGHILMKFPENYSDEKFFAYLKTTGLELTRPDDPSSNNYVKVLKEINQRQPEW